MSPADTLLAFPGSISAALKLEQFWVAVLKNGNSQQVLSTKSPTFCGA
jgi:hypothetical protein